MDPYKKMLIDRLVQLGVLTPDAAAKLYTPQKQAVPEKRVDYTKDLKLLNEISPPIKESEIPKLQPSTTESQQTVAQKQTDPSDVINEILSKLFGQNIKNRRDAEIQKVLDSQ